MKYIFKLKLLQEINYKKYKARIFQKSMAFISFSLYKNILRNVLKYQSWNKRHLLEIRINYRHCILVISPKNNCHRHQCHYYLHRNNFESRSHTVYYSGYDTKSYEIIESHIFIHKFRFKNHYNRFKLSQMPWADSPTEVRMNCICEWFSELNFRRQLNKRLIDKFCFLNLGSLL